MAAPSEHLNSGQQLHSGAQACPSGSLVINVVHKVTNDADSGVAGNAWASDDYVRQIQVVQVTPGTYCATVKYQGNFTTYTGRSPQNTGDIDAGIVGTFDGGYTSTVFPGTLQTSPAHKVKGSIGTFDYDCDGAFDCPGYFDWVNTYFSSTAGFELAWWGWIYHGGQNGTWVNSVDGNSGDIHN